MSLRFASGAAHGGEQSHIERIQPVEPGMRADRDLAQHREPASAGVDRRHAMRADRKLLLVLVIEVYLHGELAERLMRIGRVEPRQYVAWQVLPRRIRAPDLAHCSLKDLARIGI